MQVNAQGTEGLGRKVEAGGGWPGPSGPAVGGAPPGGEMVTGISENGEGLLAPAFASRWVGVDWREFFESVYLSEARGAGGGAGFCAGERAGPWPLGGAPCMLPC